MGEPVNITEMAETLIRLHGYEPYRDIKIEFTGIRPGEKLYEELFYDPDHVSTTVSEKIYLSKFTAEKESLLPKVKKLLADSAEGILSEVELKAEIFTLASNRQLGYWQAIGKQLALRTFGKQLAIKNFGKQLAIRKLASGGLLEPLASSWQLENWQAVGSWNLWQAVGLLEPLASNRQLENWQAVGKQLALRTFGKQWAIKILASNRQAIAKTY